MNWPESIRFRLTVAGYIIAALLITIAVHIVSPGRDVLINIAASFIFASTTNIVFMSQDAIRLRDLVRLFGDELVKSPTYLVYPEFVVPEDVRAFAREKYHESVYRKPDTSTLRETGGRIDFDRAVDASDIRALLYVTTLLESTRRSPNILVGDSEMVGKVSRSFISFGLSSNDCTYVYLRHAKDSTFFQISPEKDGAEAVLLWNGSKYAWDATEEYGFVVRYAPEPENDPGRRWFFIGGVGPGGTEGAAWYLSHFWRRMLREAGGTANFCAVVRTIPGSPEATQLIELYPVGDKRKVKSAEADGAAVGGS